MVVIAIPMIEVHTGREWTDYYVGGERHDGQIGDYRRYWRFPTLGM